MAITVGGTDITFNDGTTQATRQELVNGGLYSASGVFTYTLTGIPANAKQIWADAFMGYSSGPASPTLYVQNSSGSGGTFYGTFNLGATTATIGSSLIGYTGGFYVMPIRILTCFTKVQSYSGNTIYAVSQRLSTGSTNLSRYVGTLTLTGALGRLVYATNNATINFNTFSLRTYWEI